jgi:hypothetical protein
MNILLRLNLIIFICLIISGCSSSMSGTIVDAETDKPIDGAVIHVQWYETKGLPGLSYGKLYRIEEKVSDDKGNFRLKGVRSPFVNPPRLVIYKKGYVAWRNDYIFPDYQRRDTFQWRDGQVFKLERYKKYSHSRHISFLHGGLSLNSSLNLSSAYEWEFSLARKEEDIAREKRKTKKPGEYKELEFWQEIADELYANKQIGKDLDGK